MVGADASVTERDDARPVLGDVHFVRDVPRYQPDAGRT